MQQSLFNGVSTSQSLWYFFGTSLASTTYQIGELACTCLKIRQHVTQIKSSSSYLFWVVFQSHQVQQVYRSYTVYEWWCYTWGRHEALPRPSLWWSSYTFQHSTKLGSGWTSTSQATLSHLEVVSSRTVGGFNYVYSPCYFYPRVCYVYITTVLLRWPYVLVWLLHK